VLDAPVVTLAFPYGDYDAATTDMARSVGYEKVFAALPVQRAKTQDGFVVGRVNVSARDWPLEFALKIAGAYEWHGPAVALKTRLRRLFQRKDRQNGRAG